MRIFITGASGFVGRHLVAGLLERGHADLHSLSRQRVLMNGVTQHVGDMLNRPLLEAVLDQVRPTQIYHLAGYAHAGRSFAESDAAWACNLDATRLLYDTLERLGQRPRILFVGSGLVYGDGERFDESSPMSPASPYAASKAAADLLSYQVTRRPGLDVVRVRPFNHTGPGQMPDYAVPAFARQIATIERGLQAPIVETGDLSSQRDLTDVRDMVDIYCRLMEDGRTGEAYNAATGVTHSMSSVLDMLVRQSRVAVEVRSKKDMSRQGDTAVTRADISKLQMATGWQPRYSLEMTLSDTLEYWRQESALLREGA